MRYPEVFVGRKEKGGQLSCTVGGRERLHLALTEWEVMAGTLANTYQA